jgi:hypothetical protein
MMLALGKPVFVIVKKVSEEEVKSKLPSNIDWKRAIAYQETYDIMSGLITLLESRSHLKTQPFVGEIILNKPLETSYPSVKKWYSQLGKRGKSIFEQKKDFDRVITQYCQYMKMDPDQIIEHATQEAKSSSGTVKFHDDALENFLYSFTDSKPRHYWGVLRGFYKHNSIRITIHRPKYSVKQDYEKLTTEQLKRICDEGTLRSRSWILANSYIGLDVGKLVLLKVEDFHTDKWAEARRIYPVTIRSDVSGTFGYTTYIGQDAKTVLQEFIKLKKLGQRNLVWKMVRTNFRSEFNRDRERAGVGKIMNQNDYANGEHRNFVSLTPKALGKRLEDILKEEIPLSDWTMIDYLLGRKETNPSCYDDIEKAYLRALTKLTVYQTEVPPIKYRPPINHRARAVPKSTPPFNQKTLE